MDLNTDNYAKDEIEEVLSLEYPYEHADIHEKKNELHDKLTSDKNLGKDFKDKIGDFLNKLTDKLEKNLDSDKKDSKLVHKTSHNKLFHEKKNEMIDVDGHFIIENPSALKAYDSNSRGLTAAGGAPRGIINPIKYQTIKKALNIDTRFRRNYYKTLSTDIHINLPYKFERVVKIQFASIEMPLTYYAISAAQENNTIAIQVGTGPGASTLGAQELLILPDGNYEASFKADSDAEPAEQAINNALEARCPLAWAAGLRYTIDRTSGRSVFAYQTGSPGVGFALRISMNVKQNGLFDDSEPLPMKLGWTLGYRLAVYDSTQGEAVASEGICYIKGPKYMFIALDDYNNNVNNYFISAYADSIQNNNILARINLSAIQQGNGVYQSGEDDSFSTEINRSRTYFGPVDIQKIRLTIYDEFGRIIDLNNMDWSVALMFECMYA